MVYSEPDAESQKHIDDLKKKIEGIGVDIIMDDIWSCVKMCKRQYYWAILYSLVMDNLETKESLRNKAAQLMVDLFKMEMVTKEELLHSLSKVFEDAEDMIIDIPLFWQYLATYLGELNRRKRI